MRTAIFRLAAIFALVMGALVFGTAASADTGGNSANAKLCQKGGYVNYARADGTTFASEGQCVSYAAQGGTLVPLPDLRLNTKCITDAASHTLNCTFTVTNIGAGPTNGASILLQSGMSTTTNGTFASAASSGTCTFVNDPNNRPTITFPQGTTNAAEAIVECAGPLAPGQQLAATVSVGIGTVAAGSPITVTAAVDPNNLIAESNESNNTYNAVTPAP